jgi:hypothetical protein
MKPRIRNRKIFFMITMACILLSDCVQQYISPYKSPATGYLVVDGYISGNSMTQYSLSRSISLSGDSSIPAVTGASLQVEGSDGSVYPLSELGNGLYGINSMTLSTTAKYRLRIRLSGGESYLSDYVPYKPTPPIDSVNWVYNSNGVTIYVNTHDPANTTRYYQWVYDQTWEYHSAEATGYIYDRANNSLVMRTPAQQVFTCWKDLPLTDILVGSSAKLASDVIYEFPLVNIPANSQPLSVEYSILVTQYALSDSGYDFLYMMAQNTQSLGSIFDAQPSQLTGNIHSLNNPGEPVIGYIQAGTTQQQRIFITNQQVPNWFYFNQCPEPDAIIPPDSLEYYFGSGYYNPLFPYLGPGGPPGGWSANSPICTDCTQLGGTTQKPAFWPN